MDAVVAFIANGEATRPVEPDERALDDPAEHAVGAAVTCATSGTPRASVTMWCLDPALPRSVGFGPVFSPRIARTDPLSTTVQRWSSRPRRRSSARRVSCKRRQSPAVPTPPSVASTCCLRRIPFHAVTSATATRRAAQTGCRCAPRARRPGAVRRGAAHGDGASEATARDAPTAHRPREAVPCATVPSRRRKYKRSVRGFETRSKQRAAKTDF